MNKTVKVDLEKVEREINAEKHRNIPALLDYWGKGLCFIVIFAILCMVGYFWLETTIEMSPPSAPSRQVEYQVAYRVTGSARFADITVSVPGGGTEQRPVAIPYTSPTYTCKHGDHAYISAQNEGEYGTVTTEIIVNGRPLKTATSEGAYRIASLSWLVGSKD